jgi:hypothetical protein
MAYGIQFSSSMYKLGDTRLKSRGLRRQLAKNVERASTVIMQTQTSTMAAGDFPVGVALYNMVFLGGYIEQEGDEGTNGTITIERWDDVSGSTQTAISSAATLDAGAAAITEIEALVTTDIEVAAGEKINAVIASCTGSVATHITLYFKLVDDPEGDDT